MYKTLHNYFFKTFFLPAFVIFSVGVHAQTRNISGMVAGNSTRLNNASIHNTRTKLQTVSDLRGMFIIKAEKGDTLITDLLTYKKDTLVVGDSDFVLIKLKSTAIPLKEVFIRDSVLSPLKAYNNNKAAYKEIYRKGDDSHIFNFPLMIGMGININIDKLYSALSKEGKDARKLQKELTSDYKNSVVDQRFNRPLVSRITGYKGSKLDNFIMEYRPSYEFISKASDYDIVEYIKHHTGSK